MEAKSRICKVTGLTMAYTLETIPQRYNTSKPQRLIEINEMKTLKRQIEDINGWTKKRK